MRLSTQQQQAIREETARVFGARARVRLFGSRLDDARRGGDIDLYVESEGTPARLFDQQLELYGRLLRRLGDRRIDIVVADPRVAPAQRRSIDWKALDTGVPL